MLDETDAPKQAPLLAHPTLDRLGVAELRAYIAGLTGEIARAEAEILRKTSLRDAAELVFRKP